MFKVIQQLLSGRGGAARTGSGPDGSTARAIDPLWLGLIASVWLASVGNFVLWGALLQVPGVHGLRGLAFVVGHAK